MARRDEEISMRERGREREETHCLHQCVLKSRFDLIQVTEAQEEERRFLRNSKKRKGCHGFGD
jgi:hypothetical protein